MRHPLPSLIKCYDLLRWTGAVTASFSDPAGVVTGPGDIKLSDDGSLIIEFEAVDFDVPEIADEVDAFAFFGDMGMRPTPQFESYPNRCLKVEIECDTFRLVSTGKSLVYSVGYKWTEDSQKVTLIFHILRGELAPLNPSMKSAHHVAMPLCNYRGPYRNSAREIRGHGLSWWDNPLMRIKAGGDGAGEEESQDVYQRVTTFRSSEIRGFIQPWASGSADDKPYDPLGERPTALLVIDKVMEKYDLESILRLMPNSFYQGLSLSVGRPVGWCMSMLFDENFDMLRMYYARTSHGRSEMLFCPFHVAVDNHCGMLLSAILSSPHRESRNISVAMASLLKSGRKGQAIDDGIYFAARAIEALGKEFVKSHQIAHDLGQTTCQLVAKMIGDIRDAVEKAEIEERHKDKVIANLRGLLEARPSFVDYIIGLLRHFSFHDELALDKVQGWKSKMAKVRGVAVHGGVSRIEESDPFQEIRILRHMQDIAIRVILKAFGYAGTYQPPMAKWACCVSIDRIQPDSAPSSLGYE